MKTLFSFLIAYLGLTLSVQAQNQVKVQQTDEGWTILVEGKPTMINGMNWDYFPRGTNYSYSLWNQSPEF